MLTKIPLQSLTGLSWRCKVCVYVDSEEALLELAAKGKARGFVVARPLGTGFTEFHGGQHLPAWHLSHWLQKTLTR